mgnify:CR=1 FL=1
MKNVLSLSLVALLVLCASFVLQTTKKFTPPGIVSVNDSLYFDETEISNLQWREYEDWVKQKFGASSPEHAKAIPDTLVWRVALSEDYYEEQYYNPKFKDHPVVGISHEQAAAYCKWRTARVRQVMETDAKGKEVLPKSINYRLPSKAEWEEVARADFSEKTKQQLSKKKWQGAQLYNAVRYDSTYIGTGKVNPKATITAPVYMYLPNKLGIHNLFGNVGEMISEEGVYKGGGWADKMDELKAEKDYSYEKPTATVGFRCACEVKWK